MTTCVLLVDDDVELSGMLQEYLEQEGFIAHTVSDGQNGIDQALSGNYAIAVIDVMMPHLNGIEVLRRIRRFSNLPVLMLTARGDDIDRIIGLELGADDYVAKPCTPRELVARIRAILRRSQTSADEKPVTGPLATGPLIMWPAKRTAQWDGVILDLTSAEFNLLEVLAKNAGRIVSKADLSEQGLGRSLTPYDRSIDVHLSSIRQKLGTRRDGESWIQTVRGQGYQFIKE